MSATRILTYGGEPYITDPLTGTTTLVGDIDPANGSFPFDAANSFFAALPGGNTVFAADDGTGTQQPWITDGTAAGTHEIANINPGGSFSVGIGTTHYQTTVKGSVAQDFVTLNSSQVLFVAGDAAHGFELWVTDGTAAGTTLLDDIYPGTTSSNPSSITALGDGRALFAASDPAHGTELWVTNGTTAGTTLVADLVQTTSNGYPNSSYPNSFVALGGGRALFSAYDGVGSALWSTDGTASGTSEIVRVTSPSYLTRLGNGRVVFTNLANGVQQLWVTDGTASGTRNVPAAGVNAGSVIADQSSSGFGVLGDGRAEFIVTLPSTDAQLWVTDGTTSGTTMLADFGKTNNAANNAYGGVHHAGEWPGCVRRAVGKPDIERRADALDQ